MVKGDGLLLPHKKDKAINRCMQPLEKSTFTCLQTLTSG